MPLGLMKPLMVIPMMPGVVPTVPAYAGEFTTTCDVLAKCASLPLSPPQSPLTVSMVPSEFTWVTMATWLAVPPPV
jgi:hypothetical protein